MRGGFAAKRLHVRRPAAHDTRYVPKIDHIARTGQNAGTHKKGQAARVSKRLVTTSPVQITPTRTHPFVRGKKHAKRRQNDKSHARVIVESI